MLLKIRFTCKRKSEKERERKTEGGGGERLIDSTLLRAQSTIRGDLRSL